MKFAYVIEDGEIHVKKDLADWLKHYTEVEGNKEIAEYLCDQYFEETFHDIDWEVNGILFTVSETEMLFITDVDTNNVEELWGKED